MPDDEALRRLAELIADGASIAGADSTAEAPAPARILEQFQVLEAVAEAHRSWPEGSDVPVEHAPQRIAHYIIEEEIARGGMGVVYRARDTRLDRIVAIKTLPREMSDDPDRARRFEREARLIASLNHAHIATVHGLEFSPDGRRYLVMEFVEGETIAARLRRAPFSIEEAHAVCAAVARALEAAHERGVVHRDLKPSNVMIGPHGMVKVLDFGLAKRAASTAPTLTLDTDGATLTASIGAFGTPGYMSPEQIVGGAQDERIDVFALGCLLYECLTGCRAFAGAGVPDRLAATLGAEPDWAALHARTSRSVQTLLRTSLQKDPRNRCVTMVEIRRELEAVAARASSELPGRSPDTGVGHNMPAALTSFVGREREIAECIDLLETSRLVTLTGIGGSGKTRLAVRIAGKSALAHPDGVWFVDLTPVTDMTRVPAVTAAALGVREEPGADITETLVASLEGRRTLLVLDNCESALASVAAMTERLCEGETIRVLATSREPLRVPGEHVYIVPPLSVPPRRAPAADIASSEAVQLFVERARQTHAAFALTEKIAGSVAELCRRLDGVPLAIELAAARVRMLSIDEILSKLEERLRLLQAPEGAFPARHQKLQSVIEWSYDHLSAEEQRLLRAMSVLSGGGTLAAIRALAGLESDEFYALDLLTSLAEKSLVVVERTTEGETRYRQLETVALFARTKLEEVGEATAVRDRHLAFFVALAEEAEPHLSTADERRWMDRFAVEHENLLDALAYCERTSERATTAVHLASLVWRFWLVRGELELAWRKLTGALTRTAARSPTTTRAKALYLAGNTAVYTGRTEEAVPLFDESMEISRQTGDRLSMAAALTGLGMAVTEVDFAAARAYFERALIIFRELNHTRGMAAALGNLGELARQTGELEEARSSVQQAIELMRETGDMEMVILHLANLATILAGLERFPEARDCSADALRLARDLEAKRAGADAVESTAILARALSEPERSVRWMGAANAQRVAMRATCTLWSHEEWRVFLKGLRDALGAATYDALWAEGEALSYETAVDEALDWLTAARTAPPKEPDSRAS